MGCWGFYVGGGGGSLKRFDKLKYPFLLGGFLGEGVLGWDGMGWGGIG